MLSYKGFYGNIDYDSDGKYFFGHVLNADEYIGYDGKTGPELEKAFQELVDLYVEDCEEKHKSPKKSFNGKILLRVMPELHEIIASLATSRSSSINSFLEGELVQVAAKYKVRAAKDIAALYGFSTKKRKMYLIHSDHQLSKAKATRKIRSKTTKT